MFSRRYLRSYVVILIVALALCWSVTAEEDVSLISNSSQNGTDSTGDNNEGSTIDPNSNEDLDTTETTTEFPTTVLPSSGDSESPEKLPVSNASSSPSMPTMIITAQQVTLGHRMLPVSESESVEGSTETPLEESTVDPSVNFSLEKVATSYEKTNSAHASRKARYHRIHERFLGGVEVVNSPLNKNTSEDSSTEAYREMETDGGDSYGDFGEENEIPEQLPTPMALINPNGEGSNPPLEDDFAEAFKRGNSHGKRRRLRGGRRNRKHKKNNDPDFGASSSITSASEGSGIFFASPVQSDTTTVASTMKPKRYRSTTPSTVGSTVLPLADPSFAESLLVTGGSASEPRSVVKNGPKPIILSHSPSIPDVVSITPTPQLERPGGGHTEKISTYFFSTPAPASRLRLRQKLRDSLPSSSTTEAPTNTPASLVSESDNWKNPFADFPSNPFFSSPVTKIKIPDFVPIDLGLERDDRQDHIENSLSRPDPPPSLENKAYSIRHPTPESEPPTTFESLRPSPTTKSHKSRRPKPEYLYDTTAHSSPTMEADNPTGTEYFAQGSNTEKSTTGVSTSLRQGSGSHYDRTKDKVIFFKDSPYSTQHTSVTLQEGPPTESSLSSSKTVGTHLSVSDGASTFDQGLSSSDHFPPTDSMPLYTPGHVFPAESMSDPYNFKNGPPDSSHIHSPNMVDHSPSVGPIHETTETHHSIPSPHDGRFSHSFIEESHNKQNSRPGDVVYGTVQEVPAHGGPNNNYGYLPHMHPSADPHAHPLSPRPHSSPPPSHSHHHGHMHGLHSPYEMHPPMSPYQGHHDPPPYPFQPPSNHLTGSPSEVSHGSPLSPIASPPQAESFKHGEAHNPDLAHAPPPNAPDFPPISHPQGGDASGSYSPHMDHHFASHSHTMAVQPDYEPANPPLPHDHPFHKSFLPFPNQEAHGASMTVGSPDDPYHESHPYHPGPEHSSHDPSGKPGYEQSSSVVHGKPMNPHGIEFTPIPDDVKSNDLFDSFANKPFDNLPPQGHHAPHDISHGPLSKPGEEDHHHGGNYLSPLGDTSSPYHNSNDDKDHNLHFSASPDHGKNPGYSGPVAEIHSGTYNPEQNLHDHAHSYHETEEKLPYPSPNHPSQDGPPAYKPHEDLSLDYKPGENAHSKPPEEQSHDEGQHGHHESNQIDQPSLPGSQGKKEAKRPGAFSNTPYVLMFPQLIPEQAMRPSPPSMLSKEIPVIQASSMANFGPSSGEKPPLTPGFQAVPVHPRHQMYQVLAKNHYEKSMEKYMESKKRPPSAIYTPYGILIPVGTNVEASASNQHMFTSARFPPKPRAEKSLLTTLLGLSSSTTNRFYPPNTYGGFDGTNNMRQNKVLEYEPALDILADKLALKILSGHQTLNMKSKMGSQGSYSEHRPQVLDKSSKPDGKHESDKSGNSKNPGHSSSWYREQDQITMESKNHGNVDLKEHIKEVLKGHLSEVMEASAPVEDVRRPATISSKLINSIFRKGRVSMPQKSGMMAMSSVNMPNKVPPPPSMQNSPHHTGIGHPFPPFSQGPSGLLGTIRRLFSFAPPDRYDSGVAPNFAGRTLYTVNGSYVPYVDGPSPRSSFYPNMAKPHGLGMMHPQPYPHPPSQPKLLPQSQYNTPFSTKAPNKKINKKKPTKKPTSEESKWQASSRLTSLKPSTAMSHLISTTDKPSSTYKTSTTTRPNHYYNTNSTPGKSNSYTRSSTTTQAPEKGSLHRANVPSKNLIQSGQSFVKKSSYSGDSGKNNTKASKLPEESKDGKKLDSNLSKRTGSIGSSTQTEKVQPTKPGKLDMFQTILGSTRSVLNFFKSEGRKAGPTVLKPRSSTATTFMENNDEKITDVGA